MKKAIIITLSILIFLIIALPVGVYFYVNLIYLPHQLIPQLREIGSKQINRELQIRSIGVSPSGKITLTKAALSAEKSRDIFLQCDRIVVMPDYKTAYESWKKEKNSVSVPLAISIRGLSLSQTPVTVVGHAQAGFVIKVNLKNTADIGWQGTVTLDEFTVKNIPVVGDLAKIKGTINLAQTEISSANIQGDLYGAPVRVAFRLSDFTSPKLELNAEFTPLSLIIRCGVNKDTLTIEQADAVYQQIQLKASGSIRDISTNPVIDVSSSLNLDLENIRQLPLEIKPLLEQLKPAGTIKAAITAKGPLNTISALQGTLDIDSRQITLLDHVFKDIQCAAALSSGTLEIKTLRALLPGCALQAQARADLGAANIPYEARISLSAPDLTALTALAKIPLNISGAIDSRITVRGSGQDTAAIAITAQASINNLHYNNALLPSPVTIDADIGIKNLNALVIHSLKVADPITLLSVKGNVDNVLAPTVNLSGSLRSDLAQLKSYAVMSLPETLKLGGIAEAAFQVQGPAAAPDTMDIAFTAASDTIEVNQYNARDIRVDGRFKAKKLTVSKLQATVYAGEFIADASIDLNKPDPDFTINTALKNFNMQTFAAETGLIPPDYQGILSAGIKAHGSGITPEKLTAHAEITAEIENGKVKNIALDTVRCKAAADYKKAQLNGKLDLLYKTIQAVSTIMVDTILTEPYIDCTAATELDLADLSILPVDPKALGLDELKLSGKVSAQVKAAGPIRNWTTGTAKAELSSKKLGIKNIIFEQVAVNAGYGKNQLKAELQSNAYGGTITAHADADLKPDNFTYKASAAIKTVDIGKLIQESKIIPQQYEGILNADGTVSGTGKITPALQLPTDTLQGSGRLDLTDGYLSDSSLVKSIADLLGIELVVNEAHGTFNAHDGSVYTEDTKLLGPTANIGITGAVGFNQALDMTGRVTLTSEGAQSISSGIRDNVFVYENEEYYTEMKIGGTVSAPKPAYTDFIKNWLKKKAPEILLKQVIGGNDSSEQESSQSSPQEAIIKGLFKILTK